MKPYLVSILLIILMASCNSSQNITANQDSQIATMSEVEKSTHINTITPTTTSSPTSTITPSLTPTPSPTFTLTPTPTSIGGGILRLAFIGKDDRGHYSLYIENLNTNEYRAVVPLSYEQGAVARWGYISIIWSPDGNQIMFNTGATQDDSLRLLDVKSGEVTELQKIPNGSYIPYIVWSPSNKSLVAYEQAKDQGGGSRASIFIVDIANGSVIEVAKLNGIHRIKGWSPDDNILFYSDGFRTVSYDPITQSKNELEQPLNSGQPSWAPMYIPQIDAFLTTFTTSDPNCPAQFDFYLSGNTLPNTICNVNLEYLWPTTMSVSPDNNWLFLKDPFRERSTQYNAVHLLDLNNLSLRYLGDSLIWLLGWTPDNSGIIVVEFTEEGQKLIDQLRMDVSEYQSQFDARLSSILQIAVIDVTTGNLRHIYQFPSTIQIMTSSYNFPLDMGIGLGINWLVAP